jgi:hypothetical protein
MDTRYDVIIIASSAGEGISCCSPRGRLFQPQMHSYPRSAVILTGPAAKTPGTDQR